MALTQAKREHPMAQADAAHTAQAPDLSSRDNPLDPSQTLDAAVIAAGTQLLRLRVHRIVGEPDRTDAEKLVADLRRLAEIIDPVVAAIGGYASHNFGWVDQRLFTNQLLNALEGDATFAIEQAADNYVLEQWGLR